MDHLPKVLNPVRQLAPIPYLEDARFGYDGKGVKEFASRINYDYQNPTGDNPQNELSSLLQNWLYFGPLKEVTAIYDVAFSKEDFLRTNDAGERIVSAEYLQDYLAMCIKKELEINKYALRWSLQLIGHPIDARKLLPGVKERAHKFRQTLAEVWEILREVSWRTDILPVVWDSIILLNTTLHAAGKAIFEAFRNDDYWVWFPDTLDFTEFKCRTLDAYYEDGGWCPRERRIVTELTNNDPQILFLMGQLDRREEANLHKSCDLDLCRAFQLNEDTYVTQHDEACEKEGCRFVGFDEGDHPSRIIEADQKSGKWYQKLNDKAYEKLVPNKFKSLPMVLFENDKLSTTNVPLVAADVLGTVGDIVWDGASMKKYQYVAIRYCHQFHIVCYIIFLQIRVEILYLNMVLS
jgi:hypothetical protein